MKLPPGFPVKVDIPVLPTVSARVTFHDFAWKNTNSSKRSSKASSSVNGGPTAATNGNASGSDESCGEGERSSHWLDSIPLAFALAVFKKLNIFNKAIFQPKPQNMGHF